MSGSLNASAEPGVQADPQTLSRAWVRIGAGTVIAAQAMVFSLALNLTKSEGVDLPRGVVHGILLASALGALVFLGGDLLRESVAAIRQRRVTVDLLFLVTLLGALGGSLIATFRGVGEVYYEVVAILIVVHSFGKLLAARGRGAALKAVETMRSEFARCRRVTNAGEEWVSYDTLREGDRVRVLPSEAIPVDGTVLAGESDVQESAVTGEWKPVAKRPGHHVQAGSHALDGELVIEATAGPRRIDLVLEQVERAQLAPSEIQAQADKLTTLFLPVVVGAATVTGFAWAFVAPWDQAVFRAMAVLLVACPCAMGLATPVAIWGALANLSKLGVVARTGDFVDQLARVDTVFLDKTGTLSTGEARVVEWRWRNEDPDERTEAFRAVFAAEKDLAHPIARALAETVRSQPGVKASRLSVVPAKGVVATVGGVDWAVGEPALGGQVPRTFVSGKWIHVFRFGAWIGAARIEESWRPGVSEAVTQLLRAKITVEVLSGDPAAAEKSDLGCAVAGGLSPEEKAKRVAQASAAGRRVLFVGDGINDASAMSAASVAIAMRGGTDLARASAAAVFAGADLRFLPATIELARRARAAVRWNLIFSFCYNVVGMVLAGLGYLHPVAAALLMVGSSAVVAWSALRAVRLRAVNGLPVSK